MATGRPVKYKTATEMQKAIDAYFAECEIKEKPLTIVGLAYALNLSRQGLLEYSAKDAFSDTVKRAKQRVEMHLEERLDGAAPTGAIFNLKNNFGWKDQSETKHSGGVMVGDASQLSEEALERIASGGS
jgi:hypothetical protein